MASMVVKGMAPEEPAPQSMRFRTKNTTNTTLEGGRGMDGRWEGGRGIEGREGEGWRADEREGEGGQVGEVGSMHAEHSGYVHFTLV